MTLTFLLGVALGILLGVIGAAVWFSGFLRGYSTSDRDFKQKLDLAAQRREEIKRQESEK